MPIRVTSSVSSATSRSGVGCRQAAAKRAVNSSAFQPLTPTTHGKPAARKALGRLLALIPDLHAEVLDHWGRGEGRVVIEFDLAGTLGGHDLRWRLIDVVELRDGLGHQRRSYFDPAPLVTAILTRPGAWLPLWRSGMWRR